MNEINIGSISLKGLNDAYSFGILNEGQAISVATNVNLPVSHSVSLSEGSTWTTAAPPSNGTINIEGSTYTYVPYTPGAYFNGNYYTVPATIPAAGPVGPGFDHIESIFNGVRFCYTDGSFFDFFYDPKPLEINEPYTEEMELEDWYAEGRQ